MRHHECNVLAKALRGRDFIGLMDYTSDEILTLIELACELKRKNKAGEVYQPLCGKTLGMIFEKSSTRTRVSFEVGMYQLGGHALFLSKNDLQIGRGESISDTAQTLSRYLDGIMIRTYAHDTIVELASAATVPIINGLSDYSHPCQALADFQTIYEQKGRLEGLRIAYIGDGNNMAHSLMVGASKLGMQMAVASPKGYQVSDEVTKMCHDFAVKSGTQLLVTEDPREAVVDADVIYTDVWASMGFESEQETRAQAFSQYQVNESLASAAKSDYLFMHCLPAHRGEEVCEHVIDGKHSVIFEQAENRLHAQKAILAALL